MKIATGRSGLAAGRSTETAKARQIDTITPYGAVASSACMMERCG